MKNINAQRAVQAYDLIYLLVKRTDEKDQLENGGGLVDAKEKN